MVSADAVRGAGRPPPAAVPPWPPRLPPPLRGGGAWAGCPPSRCGRGCATAGASHETRSISSRSASTSGSGGSTCRAQVAPRSALRKTGADAIGPPMSASGPGNAQAARSAPASTRSPARCRSAAAARSGWLRISPGPAPLGRRLPIQGLRELGVRARDRRRAGLGRDRLLRGEVVVEPAVGEAGGLHQIRDGHRGESLLAKKPGSRFEDLPPVLGRLLLGELHVAASESKNVTHHHYNGTRGRRPP